MSERGTAEGRKNRDSSRRCDRVFSQPAAVRRPGERSLDTDSGCGAGMSGREMCGERCKDGVAHECDRALEIFSEGLHSIGSGEAHGGTWRRPEAPEILWKKDITGEERRPRK